MAEEKRLFQLLYLLFFLVLYFQKKGQVSVIIFQKQIIHFTIFKYILLRLNSHSIGFSLRCLINNVSSSINGAIPMPSSFFFMLLCAPKSPL